MKSYLLLFNLAVATSMPFATAADEWGTKPLGEPVEIPSEKVSPPIKQELKSLHKKFQTDSKPVVLFENGEPKALLVLPESPTETETRAAHLLRDTLEKMTGTRPPVLSEEKLTLKESTIVDTQGREWNNAIWIGETAQAKKAEVNVDELIPEGYKLQGKGTWLFVRGNDTAHGEKKLNGTYFAVASLLEDYLDVRWLWAGDLGTVIPENKSITLPPIHEQNEPALQQRLIRTGSGVSDRSEIGLKLLGGTEEDYKNLEKIQKQNHHWLTVMKSGGSKNLNYRHAYGHWYETYAKDHPEWFALQADGTRTQVTDRPRLCKANPEVAKQKAKEIIAAYKEDPTMDSASISPNDGSGEDNFCMCQECRKLDVPNAPLRRAMFSKDRKRFYEEYPSLSNRVATFYNRIAEETVKTLPDAKLGAYAYSSYRDVPLGITMHPSIIIGFVGLDYFDDSVREADQERWDGWSMISSSLFLRPNLLHGGASLPAVYVNRLGEDIRHCYQTGMVVADFDSLTGNWATQGLNYYILAKLLWDPSTDVDAAVKDFCEKGFGKASDKIYQYFTEVEEAIVKVAKRDTKEMEEELRAEEQVTPVDPRTVRRREFETTYFGVFTPEFTNHLRGILNEASEATDDETVRARIAFLAVALEYVDLTRATLVEDKDAKKEALTNLLAWYRKVYHEHPEAINAVGRLWRTNASYRGIVK